MARQALCLATQDYLTMAHNLIPPIKLCRILKEAMRSSGANVTTKHIEDISLCGMFLMGVARNIDRTYHAHRSTAHTTTDARRDIKKLANLLLESEVAKEQKERASQAAAITDPVVAGLDRLHNTTWIRDTLDRVETEDLEGEKEHGTVDENYELSLAA